MKKFYFSKKNKVLESKTKGFYITTAIDYVNAPPHCGHALEKIQADVLARYHRLLGEEVFFLTWTDENSLKNVQAAEEEKIPIKKLVDRNSKRFYELKLATGDKRQEIRIMVARELTKKFETIYRGRIEEVMEKIEKDKIKGEFVIIFNKINQ